MKNTEVDVLVVGAGNAALCAALAAAEGGARVRVLECSGEEERGGNSRFTAGAFRFAHNGIEDLQQVLTDLSENEIANTDFGTYTRANYFDDMARLTQYRAHPDLVEILINNSLQSLVWMRGKGVRFTPSYGRQAFKIDGRFRFWGGLCLEAWGGGPGLVDSLFQIANQHDIEVSYETYARSLIVEQGRVVGVETATPIGTQRIRARAVVLACGGFESNAQWRTQYLGPGWDLAKVRGTRFNNGDGIAMALDIGAMAYGNWSGCHAVGWDRNAPEFGDLAVGDNFQKHSYPLGIIVNARGERFVDEGADFRNYT